MGGGFGPDSFSADSEAKITTGGEIHVNASGDGLDSNGDIEISGGTVYVYGPTNDGNGSLDYENNAVITGGTVIMAGSSGMAMNFGSESTQGSILVSTGNASAGTAVKLTDSSGNVIAEFTPTVSFRTVVISTPDITSDGTYTLTVGDSTQEITMSGYIYGSGMGGGFGGGGMGGGQPGETAFGGGNRTGGNNQAALAGNPDMNGGQTALQTACKINIYLTIENPSDFWIRRDLLFWSGIMWYLPSKTGRSHDKGDKHTTKTGRFDGD
ncbi:MAG: hypothetical protein ACLS48_03230 [[Eubacterium] siraeum]